MGSVLFRDHPNLPFYTGLPTSEVFPIAAQFTSSLNQFDPNLKMGYVQSWNIGFQRELSRNTVVEIRYTGNHGLHEWRGVNLNEINTVNNGFTSVFLAAQNNLQIARGGTLYNTSTNNFADQGLPGQVPIPIISSSLGTANLNSSTFASELEYGQLGSMASTIATNTTYAANMLAAGYPSNEFVVNPTVAGGGVTDVISASSSYYDSGQVELRRRLAAGMQFQVNYSYSKSLGDSGTSTLRDMRMNKEPTGFDIRNAIKANYIYELPFGPGRHFLPSVGNKVFKKAIEGWEMAGVVRLQSGTPLGPLSGFDTVNGSNSGVILHNITLKQIQGMVGIRKTENPVSGIPQVYFLPPPIPTTGLTSSNNTNFITNNQAAVGSNNLTPAQLDPSAPYVSPAAPGESGGFDFLYANWQRHVELSLIKITHIKEGVTLEFRAQALNVFNITNFFPSGSLTTGLVTSAYTDISGTYDPGGRILEAVMRVNFWGSGRAVPGCCGAPGQPGLSLRFNK